MPPEALHLAARAPVRLACTATWMEVRGLLGRARGAWVAEGAAPDACDAAEQVLAEVLNNVVEHAQAGRPDGAIRVQTWVRDSRIGCAVLDDGRPMPDGRLPAGRLAEIGDDLDALPEGGFGWFMIRSLTEDLRYAREDGWNRLDFTVTAPD